MRLARSLSAGLVVGFRDARARYPAEPRLSLGNLRSTALSASEPLIAPGYWVRWPDCVTAANRAESAAPRSEPIAAS